MRSRSYYIATHFRQERSIRQQPAAFSIGRGQMPVALFLCDVLTFVLSVKECRSRPWRSIEYDFFPWVGNKCDGRGDDEASQKITKDHMPGEQQARRRPARSLFSRHTLCFV
jgi:hypothetical protein